MKSSYAFGGMAAIAIVAFAIGFSIEQGPSEEIRVPTQPEQQMAKPMLDPPSIKEVTVGPGPVIGGGTGGGTDEICGNHVDDDGDGRIDEAPPPEPGVNWDRCDISGDDYTGEDLSGASMRGIIAVGAILNEADLTRVDARGGDFSWSEIENAKLVNARFQHTNLTETSFEDSNLQGINLSSAELSDASFRSANVSNAILNGVTFATDRVHAYEANFSRSQINSVDGLTMHANLANFIGTTFHDTINSSHKVHGADFGKTDFTGAVIYTGDYESGLSALNKPGWMYDKDTIYNCNTHVICDHPPPRIFHYSEQVSPEPEEVEDISIGRWYSPTSCVTGYSCYTPQVATVLVDGVVTWIYDIDEDFVEQRRIISGTPDLGHDGKFTSPVLEPGDEWSKAFMKPGKYHYYDEFNTDWVGMVIVFGESPPPGEPNNPPENPPNNPPNNPPKNPPEKPGENPK